MKIDGVWMFVKLFFLIVSCIFKYSEAFERDKRSENLRNVGITVNIGIVDTSRSSTASRRYPDDNPRRVVSSDQYESPENANRRPVQVFSSSVHRPETSYNIELPLHSVSKQPEFPSNPQRPGQFDQNTNNYNLNNPETTRQHHQLNPQNLNERSKNKNVEVTTQRSKSNQAIYNINGRVPSQLPGQQSYYDNGREVERRPPGQSGYQANDKGMSSPVDSFNGNVNVGVTRRPLYNLEYFTAENDVTTKLYTLNSYKDEINHNFNKNNNISVTRKPTHVIQANNGRKPVGNMSGFNSNSSGARHNQSIGYDDVNSDNKRENGRPSTSEQRNNRRKPFTTESHFVTENNRDRTSFGNSQHKTERSTTIGYHKTTSQSRINQRRTTRPTTVSSLSGCYLPEQPHGGRYELGGCDSPCDKEPGDLVPNTSVLEYTCTSGFVRNGTGVSVCLNDSWYMPSSCLKMCPALKSNTVDITCEVKGTAVACDKPMKPDTHAKLNCKPLYKIPLTDDPVYREITCHKDGLWNRQLFRCLPKCGSTIAHGDTLVVSGFTAKVGVFPWHVGIYEKKSRQVYEQICAGTLINSNLVVSAAHCFYDETIKKIKEASKYYVAAGKYYRSWNRAEDYAQKSSIHTINITDRYMGAGGNYAQDIALVKLRTPFELTGLVRPVCIDWNNELEHKHLQVGRYGKVVGWGKRANSQPSEELQEINLPFIPFDQCSSNVPPDFRGYITADKFCAGYMNGSSLCNGDSGGGLCFQSDGLWYLRGIVSVRPRKQYNSYTAFTNFSQFREWIRKEYD